MHQYNCRCYVETPIILRNFTLSQFYFFLCLFQWRSQKYAKGGARQREKILALANSFSALYPPPGIFCPRGVPGHPLATPLVYFRLFSLHYRGCSQF
jgi:hypothetical protein